MDELISFVKGKIEKYTNCSRHQDVGLIELPICEINDLPVTVYIIISRSPDIGLNLSIRSTIWDTFEDDYLLVYSGSVIPISEGVENICQKYVDTINELKVDKIQSCLTTQKSISCKIFNNNVKLRFDQCSVCLEDTNKKTPCDHPLCILCWSKIIGEEIKCPICRGIICLIE
jgi:hypothetical protein